MNRSLREMSDELRDFIEVRGWSGTKAPNMMMSLMGEVGELAEAMNCGKSFEEITLDDTLKREIGFEMVDVLNYLMRLAQGCEIDLQEMYDLKMPLLAEKYPVGIDRETVGLRQKEYRESGKNKLYE